MEELGKVSELSNCGADETITAMSLNSVELDIASLAGPLGDIKVG